MTHIDPRIDKLVEALTNARNVFLKYGQMHAQKGNAEKSWANICQAKKCEDALLEASTPLKEFAGLTSLEWRAVGLLCLAQNGRKEMEACRQIAESLHEQKS